MPNTFQAQLLTPNGPLFEGEVTGVQIPGSEGSFEVLYNHSPIVSTLGIGKVVITKDDNTELIFAVSGGFVEAKDNNLTLLAEKAEVPAEIDVEATRKIRDEIKQRLESTTQNRGEIEKELAIVENKLKIAQ